MKNDPRVTRVGRYIRKASIDEVPQLFNVLKGEMSLVGPRPPVPREVVEYQFEHLRRLDVIPGITGLQQVSGRSELSFTRWIELDLQYISEQSLMKDIEILIKTIPAVLTGRGAY
jgi:lipopolysaccharide/colanic/teichoic acid biosynthesis glycosyltransferase